MHRKRPELRLDSSVFVAPGTWIVGDVRLGPQVNVWFGSVLRGDLNFVQVGEGSNIQDQCTLHVTRESPCSVGAWVTVGHQAILHGCTVEDRCLVGMGAIVLNEAIVGEGSVIGAGCVVPEGMTIPPGSLVLGVPGKVVRLLEPGENPAEELCREYIELAREHQKRKYPLCPLRQKSSQPQRSSR